MGIGRQDDRKESGKTARANSEVAQLAKGVRASIASQTPASLAVHLSV